MAARRTELSLTVRDIPELIAEMRTVLADALREEAGAETDPRVARRLREVAAEFEAGLSAADRREARRRRRG